MDYQNNKKMLKFIVIIFLIVCFIIYSENNSVKNRKKILILSIDNNFNKFNKKIKQLLVSNNLKHNVNLLINEININYNKFDGIVIIDNKNSICYSSSLVSFLIENNKIPIYFCTKDDLEFCLKNINSNNINEICINKKNNLLRAVSSTICKNSIVSKYPPLNNKNKLQNNNEKMLIRKINENINIEILKIYPNTNVNNFKYLYNNKNINAIIIDSYNNNLDDKLLNILNKINENILIINIGNSNNKNIINCNNVTLECVYAKCLFLLSFVKDNKLIKKLFETNYRGEINI